MSIDFSTAGSMGDSVYQTLFIRELTEHLNDSIGEVHLQIGKPNNCYKEHVYGNQQFTQKAAEFLAPLFESQGWTVTISDNVDKRFIDIDEFRKLKLNFTGFDIRLWAYQLVTLPLPMNLQRQTLDVPDSFSFSWKVLLTKTDRYCNPMLDWNILKPIQRSIVFIGLEDEYKDFRDTYFPVEFHRCKDALEVAKMMKSAVCVIGNQGGLYSIAEQLKVNRCLLVADFMKYKEYLVPGPCNVVPQGGNCFAVSTNGRLEAFVKNLQKDYNI